MGRIDGWLGGGLGRMGLRFYGTPVGDESGFHVPEPKVVVVPGGDQLPQLKTMVVREEDGGRMESQR